MKSFREFLDEGGELQEGIIRAGAISSYGAQSRRYGEEAVRAYRAGKDALRKGGQTVDAAERLERIETALDSLFDALIKQRQQIGSGVAVDVAGHMLAARARRQR